MDMTPMLIHRMMFLATPPISWGLFICKPVGSSGIKTWKTRTLHPSFVTCCD
ncbi:hypothetical protein PF005_g11058 [Phytophthora fragariae]|uniref:Uncharacterized protein n=1 Tax=Phytophthora fragariae TaxID=53985 RepID=A0A6A3SB53_9STRA|nr:hypothetical protein PF003_g32083 [Phytophthora fragariae]KAE8938153.1 hypothetical protein PF009_g11963 [Phytophthora fragariae]KAE9112930.1 hypothetical protein PF007_g10911 [Phytophthora fragariae]KAE9145070.1 hypothetical protein PF006_g10044 [Phytophthora fragariae]KAE9211313.1 hypothetical protein PF005_g11058 [Phytophthora fragariae]